MRALTVVAVLALAGCGGGGSSPSPQPVTPASAEAQDHSTPAAAMQGLLAATRGAGSVSDWLPPPPSQDIAALDSAAAPSALGLGSLFWETAGVTVTAVVPIDGDHATVVVSGPLTWCLGKGPGDPAAACTEPYGVGQSRVAFPAIRLGTAWFIDMRCNNGAELVGNPAAGS